MLSPLRYELKRSKYRVLGLVGQGQFGRVYCAIHRQTRQFVALKNLEHQRFPTHQFLRELRFLLSLQHPNIVTCQALEHTRTGRYLVMDYCEGGTLRGLMREESRLNLPQSIALVTEILAGLDHAHHRGIVHCDVKPENILLNVTTTGWTARISDFGIARLSQDMTGTAIGGNTGSPAYMAPERFYGQYSPSSDLYAVGVLLYELLVGNRPFTGTPAELMSAHLNHPLKLPDAIAPVWHPILTTALQKLAARRFRTAGEMLAAIRQVATSENLLLPIAQLPVALHLRQPPILTPITPLPTTEFKAQQRIPLSWQVIALVVEQNAEVNGQAENIAGVFCGGTEGVWYQSWQPGASLATVSQENPLPPSGCRLSEPVQQFVMCPQGCFAIAHRMVYLLSNKPQKGDKLIPAFPHPLMQDSLMALDPKGRWMMAIASPNIPSPGKTGDETGVNIAFALLPQRPATISLADSLPLNLSGRPDYRVLQLLPLDGKHGAIALRRLAQLSPGNSTQTQIDVFTRRGNWLSSFSLPMPLHTIQTTATPHRLVALDEQDPHSLLMIDLKPFRINRVGLEIAPQIITLLPWGYLLTDQLGQMLLLDDYGQRVGLIAGPANPTAIAPLAPHLLAIATWNGQQGYLFQCDLRELELDFMF